MAEEGRPLSAMPSDELIVVAAIVGQAAGYQVLDEADGKPKPVLHCWW